jgi:hypothetical protein
MLEPHYFFTMSSIQSTPDFSVAEHYSDPWFAKHGVFVRVL